MLLRRVTEHVKSQNWTAVGIDFLIVVIGVFVGIQVSNWNEERSLVAQENVYMRRLLEDAERMIETAESQAKYSQKHLENVTISLDALQSCELSEESKKAMDRTLINHQVMPRLLIMRATYDEMVAGGALARISDLKLKEQISATFSFVEADQEVIGYFSTDLGRASDIIWRNVSFSMSIDDLSLLKEMNSMEVESLTQKVSYTFDDLCTNAVFRNAMLEVLDSALDRQGVGALFIKRLTDLQEMIQARLEQSP